MQVIGAGDRVVSPLEVHPILNRLRGLLGRHDGVDQCPLTCPSIPHDLVSKDGLEDRVMKRSIAGHRLTCPTLNTIRPTRDPSSPTRHAPVIDAPRLRRLLQAVEVEFVNDFLDDWTARAHSFQD